jgi:hypothetical protein
VRQQQQQRAGLLPSCARLLLAVASLVWGRCKAAAAACLKFFNLPEILHVRMSGKNYTNIIHEGCFLSSSPSQLRYTVVPRLARLWLGWC